MNLTTHQFIVLESIFVNAVIPMADAEKYVKIANAMKSVKQLKDSSVEMDINSEELKLLFPFILESSFKISEINFVLEFLKTIGLMIGEMNE